MKWNLPAEVKKVAQALQNAGFEAHLVGGSVRDLILGRDPKDWDIATNAKPAQVQELFPDTVYENDFGTVGVKTESEDPKTKVVEVTTYRIEGKYTDKRHPDEVRFARTVEEDLSRRDFTVNAIAAKPDGELVDPHSGRADLEAGTIRTVGDPEERFGEDALRLLRAVRFAAELGFGIEPATRQAIVKLAGSLEEIAKERIRDEFLKMILTERAADGVRLLEELGLLRFVLPEIREGIGVTQDKHHIYTVFEHNVRALEYSAKQGHPLAVRLAAFLHDVGKPRTKEGEAPNSTFYNHEVVGAKMAVQALDRLHVPKDLTAEVAHLVRWHMFYYNVGEVSPAGVRRFLRRVGPEYIDDLIRVREADRIGSGVPKAVPYKLRHLLFMIEKVKHDPISPKMLAVNGEDVMEILKLPPGPKVGRILAVLLEDVLDDPARNDRENLKTRVRELGEMDDAQLDALARKAREKKEAAQGEVESDMKRQFRVQ